MTKTVGKQVLHRLYAHCSAFGELSEQHQLRVQTAESIAGLRRDVDYNVARIDSARGEVGLLSYPTFFTELFPALEQSWRIHLESRATLFRDYRSSLNPPILHRKELMIPRQHPSRAELEAATKLAEEIGLFDDPHRIGFRQQWLTLVEQKGYQVQGNSLCPAGNTFTAEDAPIINFPPAYISVQRHLTALSRRYISAPVQLLLRMGLLTNRVRFFDYGCGRGGDIAALTSQGLSATGWDPHFAPSAPRAEAEVVNLGFVINVIEEIEERIAALQSAYALTRGILAVSVMLESTDKVHGQRYRDGFLTSRQTFQKYFTQGELQRFVEAVLDQEAVPVAPGIVFVFRDPLLEQQFHLQRRTDPTRASRLLVGNSRTRSSEDASQHTGLTSSDGASRYRSRSQPTPSRQRSLRRSATPKRRVAPLSTEQCCAVDALWSRFLQLGREPKSFEVEGSDRLITLFGSWVSAVRAAKLRGSASALEAAAKARSNDLRVFFALNEFSRRRPFSVLDPSLQEDIRAFFGSLAAARGAGRLLLSECANAASIEIACKEAAALGLGWLHEDHSLQLHTSLVPRLNPVLQAYVGCATALYGDISNADLVKIHIHSGKLTLMRFDDFAGKAIPLLVERVKIKLREQDFELFEYGQKFPPPVLLFKSRYINEEFDGYPAQLECDRTLERLQVVAPDELGPIWTDFQKRLEAVRRKIVGTSVTAATDIPSLDAKCGRHFTYRQLIECGETWSRVKIDNTPKQAASFNALFELASTVLDPVIDYFGMIRLTYGFSSHALSRHIPRGIAPKLDQHASCEHTARGMPICARLGAAVDFFVEDEDMASVANWIIDNCEFDRLYFYGHERPIHVSLSDTPQREIYVVPERGGRRMPPRRVDHVSETTSPLSR